MDNESYIYPLNPDDNNFPEKFSVVHGKDETEKIIDNLRRDKENLVLILITTIIGVLTGFFTQSKNYAMVFLLLDCLIGIIIWKVISYNKKEDKFVGFFERLDKLGDKFGMTKHKIE